MGAVLPLATPRPTIDVPGTPAPQYTDASARALEQFGGAITDLAAGWQAQRGNDAEASFQAFQLQEHKTYNDTIFATKPEASEGFATGYGEGFKTRSDKWLTDNTAGMTPREQDRYRARMIELQIGIYDKAIGFERGQYLTYTKDQLDKQVQGIYAPRAKLLAANPDDPATAEELDKLKADVFAAIDALPGLDEANKAKQKQIVERAVTLEFMSGMPRGNQVELGHPVETFSRRVVGAEGSRPNDKSSAVGKGQFIDATWLRLIRQYRPELAAGKTPEEILALRTAPNLPDLPETMVRAYAAENQAYLKAKGLPVTAGNLYLAHFLGPAGAEAMLSADPQASAASDNPAAAKANPSVFYAPGDDGRPDLSQPRSVADIQGWSGALMAGTKYTDWSRRLAEGGVTYDEMVAKSLDASGALTKQQKDAAAKAKDAYDAQLNAADNGAMDGTFGLSDLGQATKTWLTDAQDRKRILASIEKYQGDTIKRTAAFNRYNDPTQEIVPQLPQDREQMNLVYDDPARFDGGKNLGEADGKGIANLRDFVDRTGMVPTSAAALIKNRIRAHDPAVRDRFMGIMEAMYNRNPPAVAAAFDDGDFKLMQDYQVYKPILSPEDLAKRMNPYQDQQLLNATRDRETAGRKIFTDMGPGALSDILDAFDPSGAPFNIGGGDPLKPADPGMLGALQRDAGAAFAERYGVSGDAKIAFTQMIDRLKRMGWGPTDIGSGKTELTFMPPERKYPPLDGSWSWIDDQAAEFSTMRYPGYQSYHVVPTPNATAEAASGLPPSYYIGVFDKDGVYHLETGTENQGFVFDYAKAKAAKQEDDLKRLTVRKAFEGVTNPSADWQKAYTPPAGLVGAP